MNKPAAGKPVEVKPGLRSGALTPTPRLRIAQQLVPPAPRD
jgi:hypothetical protein